MSEEEKQIHLYMHSKNELGLATLCVEKDKEIERLNNDIKILLQENGNKEKVIKAQDNIIKEVREYIEDIKGNYFKRYDEVYKMCEDLLDILKGVDKE